MKKEDYDKPLRRLGIHHIPNFFMLMRRPKVAKLYEFLCKYRRLIINQSLPEIFKIYQSSPYYNGITYRTFIKHMKFLAKHNFLVLKRNNSVILIDVIQIKPKIKVK